MNDLYGRPLRERFRKRFLVGDPVREHISVEHWKILPPVTGSQQALALKFTNPLDWALLLQTITIESADGLAIDGRVVVTNTKGDGASHQLHLGSQGYITYASDRVLRMFAATALQGHSIDLFEKIPVW